jgi:hypothetical protein
MAVAVAAVVADAVVLAAAGDAVGETCPFNDADINEE